MYHSVGTESGRSINLVQSFAYSNSESLTGIARAEVVLTLQVPFSAVYEWSIQHLDEIEAAREAYDRRTVRLSDKGEG